jgi:hypothetical protein
METAMNDRMARHRRRLVGLLLLLELAVVGPVHALPIDGGVEAPTPDVVYNFYVPPVPAGSAPGVGAQLYVAPRPVPPRVGHTWHTYPPFMPHEFLYRHRRRYIRQAGAMGLRTDVHAYWW